MFDSTQFILLNCQNLDSERSMYIDFLRHPNVSEILYDQHVKLYTTWNDGIRVSHSDYIVNSNIDDHWRPDFLEVCASFLERSTQHAVVSTRILTTSMANQIDSWQSDGELPFLPYPQSTAGPCPMWRRSLHDQYGYFDNHHVIGDARMWEKWHAGGEKFGLIDMPLVLYYRNPESLERRSNADGVRLRDIDLGDKV